MEFARRFGAVAVHPRSDRQGAGARRPAIAPAWWALRRGAVGRDRRALCGRSGPRANPAPMGSATRSKWAAQPRRFGG